MIKVVIFRPPFLYYIYPIKKGKNIDINYIGGNLLAKKKTYVLYDLKKLITEFKEDPNSYIIEVEFNLPVISEVIVYPDTENGYKVVSVEEKFYSKEKRFCMRGYFNFARVWQWYFKHKKVTVVFCDAKWKRPYWIKQRKKSEKSGIKSV
jgi:hypothetical protein